MMLLPSCSGNLHAKKRSSASVDGEPSYYRFPTPSLTDKTPPSDPTDVLQEETYSNTATLITVWSASTDPESGSIIIMSKQGQHQAEA